MARRVGMYSDLPEEELKKVLRRDKRKAMTQRLKSALSSMKGSFSKIIGGIALAITVLRGLIGLFFDFVHLIEYIFG